MSLVRTAKGAILLGRRKRKGEARASMTGGEKSSASLTSSPKPWGGGTEKEKELNDKCRKLALQVCHISISLNDSTNCSSSISARRSESNALEIESIHAPSKTAHRRDVCCSGPTTWFRTRSPFVLVEREIRREKGPTARCWPACDDRRCHGN